MLRFLSSGYVTAFVVTDPVWGSRIWIRCFFTLGSGMEKYPDPGSGIHNKHPGSYYQELSKLPMYLFFYIALVLSGFEGGISITRAISGGGPKNLDFFVPKWDSLCSLPF
jgi:hypothetical protein